MILIMEMLYGKENFVDGADFPEMELRQLTESLLCRKHTKESGPFSLVIQETSYQSELPSLFVGF